VCPQCGKTFADVRALIGHVDREHGKKAATSDCIIL
jgi:uncharacterized C2H2 Zn-finger protein